MKKSGSKFSNRLAGFAVAVLLPASSWAQSSAVRYNPNTKALEDSVSGTFGTWTGTTVNAQTLQVSGTSIASLYQPLDSDLTAIAALTTTTFGRSFLALADAAAGRTALGLGTAATSATGDFVAATSGTASGVTLAGATTVTGTASAGSGTVQLDFSGSGKSIKARTISMDETSTNSDSMIYWGLSDRGNNISFRGSSQELIVSSRERVAIVPDQRFAGTGFVQLGNNGPTSEVIFVSQEGSATASTTVVPSHRFALKWARWNGSANVDGQSVIQGTSSGSNGVIEFYPDGNVTSGTYNAGTGRYDFGSGTRTLSVIGGAGLRTIRTASSAPAYSFDTNTTTGMGCDTGGGLFLSRAGTAYLSLDSTYGVLVTANNTVTGRIQAAAGSASANSICRTDDAGRGINFATAGTVAVATGSANRLVVSSTGAEVIGSGGTILITGGTSAAPSNTSTPAAWTDVIISGTTFKLPLYQ